MSEKIQLGIRVLDAITGITGIATGLLTYLDDAPQVQITPPADSDGKPIEPFWVTEARCESYTEHTGLEA